MYLVHNLQKYGTRPFAIIGLIVVGNPTAQVITSEPFGI